MTTLQEFINEVAPKHTRTSCTDEKSNENEYANADGYPRCVRCALLQRLKTGGWPYGSDARIETIHYRK